MPGAATVCVLGAGNEPRETGADLYFGIMTALSEIKACQVFNLSIRSPQVPRAVSALVPGHILEEALTEP